MFSPQHCFSASTHLSLSLSRTPFARLLSGYLNRFSGLAGPVITCGPVLNWLELDNRGHRLLVTDDCDINTPAVAAAYAVRRYAKQAPDEISFEVNRYLSYLFCLIREAEQKHPLNGVHGLKVGTINSEFTYLPNSQWDILDNFYSAQVMFCFVLFREAEQKHPLNGVHGLKVGTINSEFTYPPNLPMRHIRQLLLSTGPPNSQWDI